MPWGLKRYQKTGDVHFITLSCHRRSSLLATAQARETFVITLERVRRWYGFYLTGFVVMAEHVHLLLSELERGTLAVALQLAEGLGNREMAFRLGIYNHTVKFHISSILDKLGASTRTEAVTMGIRMGIILL
jgi:DNA-binding NarL/FixJ family response regulator